MGKANKKIDKKNQKKYNDKYPPNFKFKKRFEKILPNIPQLMLNILNVSKKIGKKVTRRKYPIIIKNFVTLFILRIKNIPVIKKKVITNNEKFPKRSDIKLLKNNERLLNILF